MYDPAQMDSAPKVRIAMMGQALQRRADVEWITGGRLARAWASTRWILGGGLHRVTGVYVESSTSTATPADLLLFALARLRGRPVGIYFRDAYQLYRDRYPLVRRRQRVMDAIWHVTMPLLKRVATYRFAPSAGLAQVLALRGPILLPPGTDPELPDLGAGSDLRVAYVGSLTAAVGFDLLLAAMALVREVEPSARLTVVAPPTGRRMPAWVDLESAGRDHLPEILRSARVCVIPLPVNPYTNMAVPVKLMDYLSLGKPIVATCSDETRRLLEPTEVGVVVDDVPRALAAGLLRVLTEPGLAEILAARARALAVVPDLTWDARARTVTQALLGAGA
jgi:glycosyltransferase involved in cell wall biosynthesis